MVAVKLHLPVLYDVEPNDGILALEPARKPIMRGDCVGLGFNAIRPCRVTDCYYHVKSDKESCVLDVADLGGVTLEEVGEILGVTRERVRQIEERALRKLKRKGFHLEFLTD